jgi:2-keto-3-deoxy-L-rhamnonate aldolase RhmA
MRTNRVKLALHEGRVQVGTWIHTLGSRQLPRVLATAGYDYVLIDMEHSAFSIETVADLCQAATAAGLLPVVRPPAKQAHLISRPLDNGAVGIWAPHVDTREDAEAVVRAAKFPPLGERGSQPPNANTDFASFAAAQYMADANRETLVMVQIESRQALNNLDAILTTPGVDGACVGRGDLSADLGVAGARDHPEVLAGVEAMIAACRRHGRIPGLLVQDVPDARAWIAKGIRMVSYSSEVMVLRDAARAALAEIRA